MEMLYGPLVLWSVVAIAVQWMVGKSSCWFACRSRKSDVVTVVVCLYVNSTVKDVLLLCAGCTYVTKQCVQARSQVSIKHLWGNGYWVEFDINSVSA